MGAFQGHCGMYTAKVHIHEYIKAFSSDSRRSTKEITQALNRPHQVQAIDPLTIDIVTVPILHHQAENLGIQNHYLQI